MNLLKTTYKTSLAVTVIYVVAVVVFFIGSIFSSGDASAKFGLPLILFTPFLLIAVFFTAIFAFLNSKLKKENIQTNKNDSNALSVGYKASLCFLLLAFVLFCIFTLKNILLLFY